MPGNRVTPFSEEEEISPEDCCALTAVIGGLPATAIQSARTAAFLRCRIGAPHPEVFENFWTLPQCMTQGQTRNQHLADRNRNLRRRIGCIDDREICPKIILRMRRRRERCREHRAGKSISCDIADQTRGAARYENRQAHPARDPEHAPAAGPADKTQGHQIGAPGAKSTMRKESRLQEQADPGQGKSDPRAEKYCNERSSARMRSGTSERGYRNQGYEKDDGGTHSNQWASFWMVL